MHSLWGAGQMMFTKIMIVVDGDVDIHDNQAVAKYISLHTDPSHDITFSQGPVDVLDHSCAVMAFGGKMGIDATKKLPEELSGRNTEKDNVVSISLESLQKQFPDITGLNATLPAKGISVIFIAIRKNRKGQVREMAEKLFALNSFDSVKAILFVEDVADIDDTADLVWRFTNNLDPKRDHLPVQNHIAFDGTRKTPEHDDFTRDWPNILAMDEVTAQRIDEIWMRLGLGSPIPSPSLKYRKQLYTGGAVAE